MIGWILAALAAGLLVGVGAAALVAPRAAMAQYGIVVDEPRALAFVRAMGVRDLALGVLVALLASTGSRELVAWALWAAAPIAVVDCIVVTADRPATVAPGRTRLAARLLHAGGAIGLLLAGGVVRAGY